MYYPTIWQNTFTVVLTKGNLNYVKPGLMKDQSSISVYIRIKGIDTPQIK